MSLSRMVNIVTVGSLVCTFAIASVPTDARAAAAAPPDGSYKYSITRAGSTVGSTALTVGHAAPNVTIHEVETFGGVTETVDESLSAGDLTPTGYVSTFPVTSDVTVTARVAFYTGGARFTLDTVPGSTDF